MKLIIAEEDAFKAGEQAKLEKAGYLVVYRTAGRYVEVYDDDPTMRQAIPAGFDFSKGAN